MRCRCCSRPLQRAITDFGADLSFGQVNAKLQEHYGITVPESTITQITYHHAAALTGNDLLPHQPPGVIPLTLIAEVDGSMIPIARFPETPATETTETTKAMKEGKTAESPMAASPKAESPERQNVPSDKRKRIDRRKLRVALWKEARLSLVRRPEAVEPAFAVTLGDAETTGKALKQLALAVGLTKHTHVHGLGDGAPWIAEQFERQFGTKHHYLIDFYHLCDYLAAAATVCAPAERDSWLARQKERCKSGQIHEVMEALKPYLHVKTSEDKQPAQAAYLYIKNRPGQFNYPDAIAKELPIGSGEVESAHRYVIQKRLKLPGAWWRENHAQNLLKLRTMRANHRWDDYWNKKAA